MGRLRQAALRRTRASGGLCRSLYASRGHLQSSVARYRRRQVKFSWKDYRDDDQQKTMTLSAEEFIRRFLLHVLPGGFHRIRYYGFLGNRYRKEKLEQCRQLLGMTPHTRKFF